MKDLQDALKKEEAKSLFQNGREQGLQASNHALHADYERLHASNQALYAEKQALHVEHAHQDGMMRHLFMQARTNPESSCPLN